MRLVPYGELVCRAGIIPDIELAQQRRTGKSIDARIIDKGDKRVVLVRCQGHVNETLDGSVGLGGILCQQGQPLGAGDTGKVFSGQDKVPEADRVSRRVSIRRGGKPFAPGYCINSSL